YPLVTGVQTCALPISYYRSIPYHVKADGYIDIDEVRSLAREHRPKLLWCGATAYVREFPFEQLAAIADETGAFFATDIAHIAGLDRKSTRLNSSHEWI